MQKKEREQRNDIQKKNRVNIVIVISLYIEITIYRVNYFDVFDSGAPWWTVLSF